jgi:hypothetical protein
MTPNQKKSIVSAMRLLGKSGAGDCKKRPSADCSSAGKIGSKKRWANWRAAELERQGWTRAAADGLAKDGLAKEGLRLWPTWNLPERKAEKSRAER